MTLPSSLIIRNRGQHMDGVLTETIGWWLGETIHEVESLGWLGSLLTSSGGRWTLCLPRLCLF